jgi:hypothetical protein
MRKLINLLQEKEQMKEEVRRHEHEESSTDRTIHWKIPSSVAI